MGVGMLVLVAKLWAIDPRPPEGAHTHVIARDTALLPAVVGVLDVLFVFR